MSHIVHTTYSAGRSVSDPFLLSGRIRNVEGIREIGITSNGIALSKKLRQLKDAGLTKVAIAVIEN